MKMVGSVEVPPEAFLSILKTDNKEIEELIIEMFYE